MLLLPCTLPRGGRYTLIVGDAAGTHSGDAQIVAQLLTAPPSGRLLLAGDVIAGAIGTVAQVDTFLWDAADGDRLRLWLGRSDGSLTPMLRVIDATGVVVCAAGTSYSTAAEIASCAVPRRGLYTVLAMDARGIATGGYQLRVQCLVARCGESAPQTVPSGGGRIVGSDIQIDVLGATTALSGTTALVVPEQAGGALRLVRGYRLAFRSAGAAKATLDAPATVVLSFSAADLGGQSIADAAPQLVQWDTARGQWLPLAAQRDDAAHTISASVTTAASLALAIDAPPLRLLYLPWASGR